VLWGKVWEEEHLFDEEYMNKNREIKESLSEIKKKSQVK
jgi:hypothetical protein